MDQDTNPVDRSNLKRKLDETESPPDAIEDTTATPVTDNIDLNLENPVVQSSDESAAQQLDSLDIKEPEITPSNILETPDVSLSDHAMLEPTGLVDLPDTDTSMTDLSTAMPAAPEETSTSTPSSVLLETNTPSTVQLESSIPSAVLLESSTPSAVLPESCTPSAVLLETSTPQSIPTESLELPSLDAAPPVITTTAAPSIATFVSESEPLTTKHELPLSAGPSDEALISECEKLLEENREFEKSQMDHSDGPYDPTDDNDDQHSSDTLSVDSDTAKEQEENFKNEPMNIDTPVKTEPLSKPEDPLSTLATAALGIKPPTPAIKTEVKDVKKKCVPQWCDVGIFKSPNNCMVNGFYPTNETNEYHNLTSNNLPDFQNMIKQNLEPGTAYKFRVCAINSCGRGPWSDVSAFRTCLPGFPGAPSSIKISKALDGANISWQPPSSPSGNIVDYSICLAVKKFNHKNEEIKPNPASLSFEKVYEGESNHAVISSAALEKAYVDTTSKPAIIFRIAAKNEKGYGPATQVRWLQDGYMSKK